MNNIARSRLRASGRCLRAFALGAFHILLTIAYGVNAASGASITGELGVRKIISDGAAPRFSINGVARDEAQALVFTVTKTGATALTHNVAHATVNHTAVAGPDFIQRSGVLSVASRQMTRTLSIPGVQDGTIEIDESFYVGLSQVANGASIQDRRGFGAIIDDEDNTAPACAA